MRKGVVSVTTSPTAGFGKIGRVRKVVASAAKPVSKSSDGALTEAIQAFEHAPEMPDPIRSAYGQYCRTFGIPLLAYGRMVKLAANPEETDVEDNGAACRTGIKLLYGEFAWDDGDFEDQLTVAERLLPGDGVLALSMDQLMVLNTLAVQLTQNGLYCTAGSKYCSAKASFHDMCLYHYGSSDKAITVLVMRKRELCPLRRA
jgi:hypothetical protein